MSKDNCARFAVLKAMKELVLKNSRLDQRYDICEQLGRGSYAEIYLARDTLAGTGSPHTKVVIKALNVFLQDDLDADLERTLVENFQNEAVALDRVRHPNIISRLGHGSARDLNGAVFHYLVLEYLAGGDLQSLVRKETVSLSQVLSYVEQVCAGLGHAHRNGIIHRDIKPQNLLLTEDRTTVKIADFGVARVHLTDSPITRVGTNIYAPPEHSPMFAGRTGTLAFAQLTPAADVYSLAKSVYTLVSGEAPRPFVNETITALPASVNSEKWANDLQRVLQIATHHDSRERHQSVEEFWDDLTDVREFVAESEPSTVFRSGSAPQPHISRGYTPFAPAKPHFEKAPIGETEERQGLSEPPASAGGQFAGQPLVAELQRRGGFAANGAGLSPTNGDNGQSSSPPAYAGGSDKPPSKKHRRLKRIVVFSFFLISFTGILYGTADYMRGRGVLPDIRSLFRSRTAVATTDIYLRPSPNTDNDPIGLVTKNSKVKIVNSQNNWYQVDVVEQGRMRDAQDSSTRGWLNGKYLDIDN